MKALYGKKAPRLRQFLPKISAERFKARALGRAERATRSDKEQLERLRKLVEKDHKPKRTKEPNV